MTTVDIVVRTKNRPKFLARALADINAQTHRDWHIVVVNDGGEPEPVEGLVDEAGLRDQTRILHLPESVGTAAAGNRGISAGASPLVAVHDDDDTWHPQFLARTVEHLEHSDAGAVSVRTEIVWEKQIGDRLIETGREVFHPLMSEPTYFDQLRFNHLVPISMLYRRDALEAAGCYDESLPGVEDWVLNLTMQLEAGIDWLDGEPLAFWHQRPEAHGRARNTRRVLSDLARRSDRRYRDREVRAYVRENGPGALLYLAKYIDERVGELHERFDRVEATQQRILEMVTHLYGQKTTSQRLRDRVKDLRT